MPHLFCALVALAFALATPAGAGAASGLSLGFLDPLFTEAADVRGPWLGRAAEAGADSQSSRAA
ncbi:MAG: hypothetical protein H0W96_02870 [Solirubrobacterales bacterium]|nr:hypothetical protein [Solirubrobacterales bacterium]